MIAAFLTLPYLSTLSDKKPNDAERGEHGRASISAAVLQKRLPKTLSAAEMRECIVYGITDPELVGRVLQSYRDFVALCVRKENETGVPCLIIASY